MAVADPRGAGAAGAGSASGTGVPPAEALARRQADLRHRSDTLVAVALPVAVLAAIVGVLCLVPGFSPMPWTGFLVNLACAGIALMCVRLARRGRPSAAAGLFLGLLNAAFLSAFLLFGGVLGAYVAFFPVLVFLAGFTLGQQWAVAQGALLVAAAVAAALLARGGQLPIPLAPPSAINSALIVCSATVTIILFIRLSVRLLDRYHRDLVRLQREREQRQRIEALGWLAAGVAHDLNNLLTPVTSLAELIRMEPGVPESVRESSADIQAAAARAANLVKQLSAFATRKVDAAGEADLDTVIQEFQPLLARMLPKNVALEIRLGSRGTRVRDHRTHLEQIVLNLVVNARDALPDGGTIRIETAVVEPEAAPGTRDKRLGPGPFVRLLVKDDGVGMRPEVLAQLFEPFFTTKPVGLGTGLGLAAVQGLVAAAGGRIDVTSAPGQGSTFSVLLPVAR